MLTKLEAYREIWRMIDARTQSFICCALISLERVGLIDWEMCKEIRDEIMESVWMRNGYGFFSMDESNTEGRQIRLEWLDGQIKRLEEQQ